MIKAKHGNLHRLSKLKPKMGSTKAALRGNQSGIKARGLNCRILKRIDRETWMANRLLPFIHGRRSKWPFIDKHRAVADWFPSSGVIGSGARTVENKAEDLQKTRHLERASLSHQ
jgi:hypothetical protein